MLRDKCTACHQLHSTAILLSIAWPPLRSEFSTELPKQTKKHYPLNIDSDEVMMLEIITPTIPIL